MTIIRWRLQSGTGVKSAGGIMKKMLPALAAVILVSGLGCSEAEAAHSSVNIMSPRNTVKISRDYTYGYQYLPGDALDVYETANRNIGWKINYDYLDRHFLRPVSVAYRDWVPETVRNCFYNIHQNLREVNNTVNNALVGEFADSGISVGRFVINSTVGLCGCFDVAKHISLERKRMTMSTVLGRWGVDQGPYLTVPILGVGSLRGYIGDTIDTLYFPFTYFPWWADVGFWALNGVDSRSRLLDQDDIVANSLDPYVQTRDFYLMYQENLVTGKTEVSSEAGKVSEMTPAELNDYLEEIDE